MAAYDALTKVQTNGFFDALGKAFRGEIKWRDFFSCFAALKFEKTFEATFKSRADIHERLNPMLIALKEEAEGNRVDSKTLFSILNTRDADGVNIAMVVCSTKEGADLIAELVDKLSVDDRRILLQDSKDNSSLNLYNYIAANVGERKEIQEGGVLAKVAEMYTKCGIPIDSRQANAVLGERSEEEEVNSMANMGTGRREVDMAAVQKNQTTRMSKILAKVLPEPGQKMTAEQIGQFREWLIAGAIDDIGLNIDIFIGAFGGDELAEANIQQLCNALYDYDNGVTLKEILLDPNIADTGDESGLGVAAYAKEACFPDEICEKLLELYEKCGLSDQAAQIRERPNTGPLLFGTREWRSESALSVMHSNTGSPLKYCDITGTRSGAAFTNIRQLAQFQQLNHVRIGAGTDHVTVDDLTHLFREAKNLKKFTLRDNRGHPQHITAEMVQEAITRSGRTDIELDCKPVAASVAAPTVSLPDDAAVEELERAVLGDFDVHNGEIGNFDLADIDTREYETLYNRAAGYSMGNPQNYTAENPGKKVPTRMIEKGNAERPGELFEFIKAHHPNCPEICDHFALDTNPAASVYQTHAAALVKEFGDDFEKGSLSHIIPQHFQADCSRIVCGENRTTCVSASPEQSGDPGVFLRALALEIGDGESGLVVAIAEPRYFGDGVGGLSNVETFKKITLSNGGVVTIKKGEITGKDGQKKTIYQMLPPSWADNTALSNEVMLELNQKIEEFCAEKGIKVVNMHCAGGLGRAPTLCVCNAITRTAQAAQEKGLACCCDWDRQTERVVDGKVNLAYVVRNVTLKGAATRSTFGQSGVQFESFKSFAEAAANEYRSVLVAA
ncbi:MAG: hypothetical protein LBF26_02020 [Puniceicoccales bacterium]|nr:hypothetical protein [Puniceicoccales bacterium]